VRFPRRLRHVLLLLVFEIGKSVEIQAAAPPSAQPHSTGSYPDIPHNFEPSSGDRGQAPLFNGRSIRVSPSPLVPGRASLLTYGPIEGFISGGVSIGERSFPLMAHPKGSLAWGIIGLDVEAEPGAVTLSLHIETSKGPPIEDRQELVIAGKSFKVDRLDLPQKMVEPPSEVQERIEQETALLEEIQSRTTPRRFIVGFVKPAPGSVSSSFGRRRILNGIPKSPHSGTDVRGPTGQRVLASNTGVVAFVGDLYFSGTTVVIDHGAGIFSHYAHLSRTLVKTGQAVFRREAIGEIGMTGRATGPHLHWAFTVRGARVDSMDFLRMPLESWVSDLTRDSDQFNEPTGTNVTPDGALSEWNPR